MLTIYKPPVFPSIPTVRSMMVPRCGRKTAPAHCVPRVDKLLAARSSSSFLVRSQGTVERWSTAVGSRPRTRPRSQCSRLSPGSACAFGFHATGCDQRLPAWLWGRLGPRRPMRAKAKARTSTGSDLAEVAGPSRLPLRSV